MRPTDRPPPHGGFWRLSRDGDPAGRALFVRHYSRHVYADGRCPRLYVGPGEKMVLRTAAADALFAWRKERPEYRRDGQPA